MPLAKTKAILLKAIPYLEYNAVLKTYTPSGMTDFMAYSIKKRQPHLLSSATLLEISYYKSTRSTMHTVKEVHELYRYAFLMKEVKGMLFLGELVRVIQLTGREAFLSDNFDMVLVNPLIYLDKTRHVIWMLLPWVIIHLLHASGLLNIEKFSKEVREDIESLLNHQFDELLHKWTSRDTSFTDVEKASLLITTLADYYKINLKYNTIASELKKISDRILRY